MHCLPTTKGIDERIINGRVYIGGIGVTDPDEIEERTDEFMQRAFYYYEQLGDALRAVEGEDARADRGGAELPPLDAAEVRAAGERARGQAASPRTTALLDTYQKTLEGYFRMWHHHFEFLLLGYGAYMTFFGFCKKAFPEISDQTIARMVAGMEAEIFRPDDELRRLARVRRAAGRGGTFQDGSTVEHVLESLRGMGARERKWLEELEILAPSLVQRERRRWLLSLPPFVERRPVDAVLGAARLHPPGAGRRQRSTGRCSSCSRSAQQLIADYRELLATDEDRAAFDQMIELAHRVFPYVEGHKFYCEHWYTNLFFNRIREFGALLSRARLLREGRGRVPPDALRAGVARSST